MSDYDLAEVANQRRLLADDIPAIVAQVVPQWTRLHGGRILHRVLVVGSGDSGAAGKAASMALVNSGVLVRTETPVSALALAPTELSDVDLTVVVSASGRNMTCVNVVRRLHEADLPVVVVTGDPDSPLARASEHAIVWCLAGLRPSPGIRTYQASLLALMTIAPNADAMTLDGIGLALLMQGSSEAHEELVDELVPVILNAHEQWAPVVTALGAHVASARYIAAKVVETAGLPARADDLEEWWHIARFAEPLRTPLVVLDLPARGVEAGEELLGRARASGRPVIRTTSAVSAGIPEPWWPLWHLGLGVDLGLALARRRDVLPFAGP